MRTEIFVILSTAALFFVILVNFALQPKQVKPLLALLAFATGLGGILIYGYGYAHTEPNTLLAVLKSVFAVCGIFVGKNSFSDIQAVLDTPFLQVIFWVLHVFGFFTSVGAAISTLGASFLKRIRLLLSLRGELAIIYGVTPDTVSFAAELQKMENTSVVFVDDYPDVSCLPAIAQMGSVLREDADAVSASVQFLRSSGVRGGRREIELYAMTGDSVKNHRFASRLLRSLKTCEVSSSRTALTIFSENTQIGTTFQASEDHYGYGSVIVVDVPELASRLMVRKYPPSDNLTFDETGKAQKDFHAVIVGFGQMGQAVLRNLVMNGQFCGSHFQADIFDPAYDQMAGYLLHNCRAMLENYDIRFHPYDGRSRQLFAHLNANAHSVRYIVICTGDDKVDGEIDRQIRDYLSYLHSDPLILRVNSHQISRRLAVDETEKVPIFVPEILSSDALDSAAMIINQAYYQDNGLSAKENWKKCDYFSRRSCRASADFAPSLLRAAGLTAQQMLEQGWNPQGELLENLACTEHMRWCAFHFAMGFTPMDQETFQRRAEQYLAEVAEKGSSKLNIRKDMYDKRHACMVSWEELVALAERENAITGGSSNYQAKDRRNVQAVEQLIRAMQSDIV